jgi:hypothetical protein
LKRYNFTSLDVLSKIIAYLQIAIARLSGLLLMIGLVTTMANLLTSGAVLDHSPSLQHLWAWDQSIAVDANLWLMVVNFVQALQRRDFMSAFMFGLISALLLFVACIVTDIESVRQALNIPLNEAGLHVHVPIEFLTQVRSIVVVLLVAMSGIDMFGQPDKNDAPKEVARPKQITSVTTPIGDVTRKQIELWNGLEKKSVHAFARVLGTNWYSANQIKNNLKRQGLLKEMKDSNAEEPISEL